VQVFVEEVDGWLGRRQVTTAPEGVASFRWARTGEHIVYTTERDGDGRSGAFSVPLERGEAVRLGPVTSGVIRLHGPGHDEHHVILALNDRDPRVLDLREFDRPPRTGCRSRRPAGSRCARHRDP
jgi:glyoxylase-like metal-dependent hydrolase (beta-lactamase superfamily II)